MNYLNVAQAAETIGLPKGENNEVFRQTFQEATQIEIPITKDGSLSATSAGKRFSFLRGVDIPARIDEGLIDLGVAGTDAFLEFEKWNNLSTEEIGEAVCRFSVLANKEMGAKLGRLFSGRPTSSMVLLPTSRRRMLNMLAAIKDLPVAAMDLSITGSVEEYANLTGSGAVADIVGTGRTARAQGLDEIEELKKIYTCLGWKR